MSSLEEYAEKELEYGFYGFTVQEVVNEVKCCLEDIINAAIEDSKKKLTSKFGSSNEERFDEVRKNYMEAIENHKHDMENLIKDAFRIPYTADALSNEKEVDESSLDQEIKYLHMRSAALDIFIKEVIKAKGKLEAVADLDTSELQSKYDELEVLISQLSNNFHLANEL